MSRRHWTAPSGPGAATVDTVRVPGRELSFGDIGTRPRPVASGCTPRQSTTPRALSSAHASPLPPPPGADAREAGARDPGRSGLALRAEVGRLPGHRLPRPRRDVHPEPGPQTPRPP